ncbi:M48 family metallopeptidase [Allomesorhizobium alhagi]|uniref:YgjP-like metallopeptidase domain-containing protein n=1 Tax=Mesorhizobium alhagi CCNWXJ12-2 TaxID=1107882 RepID=H0HYX4_9HYPH|nr:M48 family metallopeptidase [Mesorhizobium alhagi]EHK54079.1 hypothetical protein MAXJ12_27043 [Mesorhizobium alhagi CCNWXJ12-2]
MSSSTANFAAHETKWGSSNPRLRTIRLNVDLVKKPAECLDYVFMHELLHFLVPDHSALFVGAMDEMMPNWRVIRQTLNDAPLSYGELYRCGPSLIEIAKDRRLRR